ncbi:MAG: histone deacetylase [Bryobacteraceae bacterium]|nr:histone deacetylase [Bryobacteraceae bacterium]MCX7603595.1 histone deacetylase [Bryobacteraceae bacterium]
MLPFKLVYHERYDLHFGAHIFPAIKYRLIRERLLGSGLASEEDFLEPAPVSREQLLLAHTEEWITKLERGTLSYQEVLKLEVPYSRRMIEAVFLAAGGTLLAGRQALGDGACFNIGGGFHHAFAGHGEGFCAVNDVAVAIRALQREGLVRKALVVDCDVHHGNGTAAIFSGDREVFTLSIHHFNNYPAVKPPSTIDIHLEDGVGDEEYLARLRPAYEAAVLGFRPEIVFYVAGVDPYEDDQLGGLSLTKEGLYERDRLVFDIALRKHVPVVVTLAGGYARCTDDTVALHVQTAEALRDSMKEWARRW